MRSRNGAWATGSCMMSTYEYEASDGPVGPVLPGQVRTGVLTKVAGSVVSPRWASRSNSSKAKPAVQWVLAACLGSPVASRRSRRVSAEFEGCSNVSVQLRCLGCMAWGKPGVAVKWTFSDSCVLRRKGKSTNRPRHTWCKRRDRPATRIAVVCQGMTTQCGEGS
jgi:hypothetical protein